MTSPYLTIEVRTIEEAVEDIHSRTELMMAMHPKMIDGSEYERTTDLARLGVHMYGGTIECPLLQYCKNPDHAMDTTQRNITLLRTMANVEDQKGRNGHWSYDRNKHLNIVNALNGENIILSKMQAGYYNIKPQQYLEAAE